MSYNRIMAAGALASALALSPALAQQVQMQQVDKPEAEKVDVSRVPQPAIDAAKQALGEAQITEAHLVQREDQRVYELAAKNQAGEEVAILVTADGQVIKADDEEKQ